MTDQPPSPGRSFGSVAGAYERGRPSYPREAAVWLTGPQPLTVLELGAGTGKLTDHLVALGHDVLATDPDPQMLAVLAARHPRLRTALVAAEEIPAPDRSFDVVVAAQAYHWFDLERALPEIARVLKPGGRVTLVWNERDERIPWVRKLGRILDPQAQVRNPTRSLVGSRLFGYVEAETLAFWQAVDRETIQDLVLSRSDVAVLDEAGREAKLAEVLAFYDDYGRGMDGMQLPYLANCFRATVVPPPPTAREEAVDDATDDAVEEKPEASAPDTDHHSDPMTTTSDGGDTDMLLIDFR